MDVLFQMRNIVSIASLAIVISNSSGCGALDRNSSISVSQIPIELHARSQDDALQTSISRLRQDAPHAYQLAPGDILGVHIEDLLGEVGKLPLVHFPSNSDQRPGSGLPVLVDESGSINLPYIKSLDVTHLTLNQTRMLIEKTYTERGILRPDRAKILVTLLQPREFRVIVVREESGGIDGVTKRGVGKTINLPAYENDVLHALNETGGLPGLDAKNEVIVIKNGFQSGTDRDWEIASMMNGGIDDPELLGMEGVVRIPLRFFPENPPIFTQSDIILGNGDIVLIPARNQEVFYTAGILQNGQHTLPRDYSINVIEAITIAGGSVKSRSGSSGISVGVGPSKLMVLRDTPCGGQIIIKIDVNEALADPAQRILVQAGDTLILKYSLKEHVANIAIDTLRFNFFLNLLSL